MLPNYEEAYAVDSLHHFPGELWNYRRKIKVDDCPHLQTPLKAQERANIGAKFGLKSTLYKSMCEGEFQASDEGNNIFEAGHVELLKKAMRRLEIKPLPGDIRAAGDVSGGGDKQVLMVRQGTEVLWINKHQCSDEILMAEYWVTTLRELGIEPFQFTIDGGGIGAPVANYMERRLDYKGINRFGSNVKPMESVEYKDRYTELHYWIKELLIFGVLALPFDKYLIEQVRDRLYIEADLGVVKTEPKEKYRASHQQRSPDELDTLVYLFSDFQMDPVRRGREQAFIANVREAKAKDPHSDWESFEKKAGQGHSGAFGNVRPQLTLAQLRKNAGFKN